MSLVTACTQIFTNNLDGSIQRHEFIDISPIFLATNLYEKVKNVYCPYF